MMKRLTALILLGTALCLCCRLDAEPLVVRKSVRSNPTIALTGSTGSAELDTALQRFVAACGWFDAVRGDADYLLELKKGAPGGCELNLTLGGAPIGAWRYAGGPAPREIAKTAVDTIIEKCFKELKIKKFCTSKIAFCATTGRGARNIYLCDIDGGAVEQLTNFKALCVEPCWTPNGRSICYSKYGVSGIDVIETTLAKPRRSRILSAFRGINAGVAVSPDARNIALILSPDHHVDLYVKNLATGKLRRMTRGIAVEASPCWSPDGREIAFVSDETGRPRIHVMRADGTARRVLPALGSDAVTPDWSGDGKIVYATRINGSYTIAVYDTKSGTNVRATETPGSWESPAWAADNRQVVCKHSGGGRPELCVIDTWTGKVRTLIATSYPLAMPAWSPCAVRTQESGR